MPYFSPKDSKSSLGVESTPGVHRSLASSGNEGAELLLSLSSSQKKLPKRLEYSDKCDLRRGFFQSPMAYDSESSSNSTDTDTDGVRQGKRSRESCEPREKQKKRSRNQQSSNDSFDKGSNPAQSPHSAPGKRVISPTTADLKAEAPPQPPLPSSISAYHHHLPHGSYAIHHPGYAVNYAVYPAHQYPPGAPPPLGFSYATPYYSMPPPPPPHHPAHAPLANFPPQRPPSSPSPAPRQTAASPSPVRDSPVVTARQSPLPRPTSRASSTASDPGAVSDPPPVKPSKSSDDVGVGRRRCLVIEGAMENFLCRGTSTFSTTMEVPEFHRLANFPQFLNKGRTLEKCPVAPAGKKYCVMCGKLRLCSSTGRGKATREDVSHIIPRQNKGVCTACDIAVWSVVKVPGLQIKWCKGCKNFRQWKSFGQKGNATKCIRCRERQKIKYASQKYGRAPDGFGGSSPRKSSKPSEDNEDDYLIAAANLRKLKESP